MPTICVIGPHSSGTRVMSRVAREGLAGEGWEIYHRSLPGSWPTRGERFIWIERDPHATMCSQIANSHALDADEAYKNLNEAREMFHLKLSQGMNVLTVHYTELVNNPSGVIWAIANWMGVGLWRFSEEIFDGDAQYRDMNLADVGPKPTVGQTATTLTRGDSYAPPPGVGVGIPPVRATGNG